MAMVKVCRFTVYDAHNDQTKLSRRWATADGLARVRGCAVEGSEREIDDKHLSREEPGLTEIGYDPDAGSAFPQRSIPFNLRPGV